jgi:hypothetical protein
MGVIARRERPHPGAQLRLTDADGWRITLFATNVTGGRIADLKVSTGCGPGPRTESAARKTPESVTCRCTTSPPTRSGSNSSASPRTCSLGPSTSPPPTSPPAPGNPRSYDFGCSTSPAARSGLAAATCCDYRGWPWAEHLLLGQHRLDNLAT